MVSDCEVEVNIQDFEGSPAQDQFVTNSSHHESQEISNLNRGERISGEIQPERCGPGLEPKKCVPGLEPATFLYMFASGFHSVIMTNLIMDKACRVNFNYTNQVCDNINEYQEQNDRVQEMVTTLNMCDSFLSAIPCILVALLVGPWSDVHGRKPVMMIPIIGHILAQIIHILNVYYEQAPAEYNLIADIYSLFGGNTCFLIGMYSYLADTSTSRSRTTRIAFLDISCVVGYALGNFLSGFVFKAYGYYVIFGVSLAAHVLAAMYLALIVEDTRGNQQQNGQNYTSISTFRKYSSMFNFQHVSGVFQTCLKKRENKVRRVIWLLMLNMLLFIAMFYDGGIPYLFTRKMFDWDTGVFTRFTTIIIISGSVCNFLVIPLLSFYLQIHDTTIAILDTIMCVAGLVVMSISKTETIFMLGYCLGLLRGQISVSIRSLLSKVTPEAELGAVFSLLGGLEAAIPLAASPLFTVIYNNTLEKFVGCVFLVEAGLIAISTLVFCYIWYLLRNSQQFNILVEEEEPDGNNQTI